MSTRTNLADYIRSEVEASSDGVDINEQALANVVEYYRQLGVEPIDIVNSRPGYPIILWELYHFALVMMVPTVRCAHLEYANGYCAVMECKNYYGKRPAKGIKS